MIPLDVQTTASSPEVRTAGVGVIPARGSSARAVLLLLALAALLPAAAILVMVPPQAPRLRVETAVPRPMMEDARLTLATPGYAATCELASYNDELFAFLMFD
jgi:hypothetical protein